MREESEREGGACIGISRFPAVAAMDVADDQVRAWSRALRFGEEPGAVEVDVGKI